MIDIQFTDYRTTRGERRVWTSFADQTGTRYVLEHDPGTMDTMTVTIVKDHNWITYREFVTGWYAVERGGRGLDHVSCFRKALPEQAATCGEADAFAMDMIL